MMTKPFTGTINMDIQDAVPNWRPYEQPRAARDAPNVLWHGWSVQTHSGDTVGSVKGQFDTGPYAGQLRVHQARTDGTTVFAIPVSAVATSENGLIVLTHSASPALADCLAYVIRRRSTVPAPSP